MTIARALGIDEVREEPLDGCEGMLFTNARRSHGKILVNTSHGLEAARFSIAHELGHYLLERHELTLDGMFSCNLADMRQARSMRMHLLQEVEANEFAIGLLAPAYATRAILAGDPGIEAALSLRSRLELSLEASTRYLVDHHDEPLAAIWAKDGLIRYVVRGSRFPWITAARGTRLPQLSLTARFAATGRRVTGAMSEVAAVAWTNADIPELFEQVRVGRDGHSLTLLWATLPDTEDED